MGEVTVRAMKLCASPRIESQCSPARRVSPTEMTSSLSCVVPSKKKGFSCTSLRSVGVHVYITRYLSRQAHCSSAMLTARYRAVPHVDAFSQGLVITTRLLCSLYWVAALSLDAFYFFQLCRDHSFDVEGYSTSHCLRYLLGVA